MKCVKDAQTHTHFIGEKMEEAMIRHCLIFIQDLQHVIDDSTSWMQQRIVHVAHHVSFGWEKTSQGEYNDTARCITEKQKNKWNTMNLSILYKKNLNIL